jgi:DNA-binding NtrC family response regulator
MLNGSKKWRLIAAILRHATITALCSERAHMLEEILIVDDNLEFSRSLGENLQELGFRSRNAQNGSVALAELAVGTVQLVLLDIVLGDDDGLDVLKRIRRAVPHVPVIMITGFASVATAVQAMKLGAVDYIQKPVNITVLSKLIDNAISTSAKRAENECRGDFPPKIITRNEAMLELLRKAERIAKTKLPVLICGENGTGKELIADFVHANSSRHSRPIVKINCSAFPESLLDNELFGHERGAYTGADSTFRGVFEKSDKGTLFLDEISDMHPSIQAKILRTLQNGEIRRIGGSETINIDVRFIAATNRDVQRMIAERTFREDLFYRMNAATLEIPPLRSRKEDIPLLVDYFLNGQPDSTERQLRVSSEVINVLLSHSWSGNIRELKNSISYAASLAARDTIELDDLPPGIISHKISDKPFPPSATSIEDMERIMIGNTLRQCANNKKRAAETLNISRNTLYSKMRKYGFDTTE